VHLATCLTQHDRVDCLEVNGGKGLSSEKAQITVVGEAVERLAAWEANRRIQHDGPKIIKEDTRTFHLQDFHPFGPPWEIYLAHQQPKLPMVEVLDEITGDRCAVPECLVPFSYAPNDPSLIATACDSAGLAAYPTYEGAVLRGALEVLERNNLYPALKNLRSARNMTQWIPQELDPAGQNLWNEIHAAGLSIWILSYPDPVDVPIAHAFLYDPAGGFMSRGSGSGLTFGDATTGALVESLQIRERHKLLMTEGFPDEDAALYAAWAQRELIDILVDYLNDQPPGGIDDARSFETDAECLQWVMKGLVGAKRPLLVVRLPEIVVGWSSVRVLIPGMTTHQYPSHSAGGSILENPAFPYPIPH